MKVLLALLISLALTSCSAQKKAGSGVLKGKVDIGPLCPQEPCNPTPEKLRQVYASYEIILTDSTGEKILYRIPIARDGSFKKEIAVGEYLARIKPITGSAFHVTPISVKTRPKQTTSVHLAYDTGIR